jgi:hypothetical protein
MSLLATSLMVLPTLAHAEDVAGDEPVAAVAAADGPHRLHHSGIVALRLNPRGLIGRFEVGYRHALFAEKEGILFQDTYVGASAIAMMTPAFGKAGVLLTAKPLAVLELMASYEAVGYFGGFDLFQSFESPGAEYSDGTLGERAAAGENYATRGHQITLGGRVQAKVGPVAVRNTTNANYFAMNLREGDTVFYDITLDILAPGRGLVIANDLDVLYVSGGPLTAGIRWTATHALYGDVESLNTPTHRAGPLLVYTFSRNPGARFNEPSLLVVANWWTSHRYRAGQAVSQAMPYLVVGFTYTGDLL